MNCNFCNAETYNPRFCSSSCAAKYNNAQTPKRKPEGVCKKCNCPISKSRKTCKDCLAGLEKKTYIQPLDTEQFCNTCGILSDKTNSYICRNRFSTNCRICSKIIAKDRKLSFKKYCVEYKGGKCQRCGYSKNFTALDFHHIDESKKDFGIANCDITQFNEKIKNELDKCILLCSNCHREHHHPEANNTKMESRGFEPLC